MVFVGKNPDIYINLHKNITIINYQIYNLTVKMKMPIRNNTPY